jgi:hypothetical protein
MTALSMNFVPRVVAVRAVGAQSLHLTFADGVRKRVNIATLMRGPVFDPLRLPEVCAQVEIDHVAGTTRWPNGVDLSPEVLYALPDEDA